jgi:hypothetical protein
MQWRGGLRRVLAPAGNSIPRREILGYSRGKVGSGARRSNGAKAIARPAVESYREGLS